MTQLEIYLRGGAVVRIDAIDVEVETDDYGAVTWLETTTPDGATRELVDVMWSEIVALVKLS